MAIFRVEKTRDYTIMSNHHLKNRALSLKAKGLLSLILSLPDDWNYSLKGLTAISVEGIDAIRQAIAELERQGYIVRERTRDARGCLRGAEYVVYEQPSLQGEASGQEKESRKLSEQPTQGRREEPTPERPMPDAPVTVPPIEENPMPENPALAEPTQLNTKGIKDTYPINKTAASNPNQSNPYPSNLPEDAGEDRMGWERDGLMAADAFQEAVLKRIEYDVLAQDAQIDQGRLDEIVSIMLEVLCATNQTMLIAGNEYPTALVRERFRQITSQHIQYVFHCLNKNTSRVRNIKKYLLSVLFNAPATMDGYYAALINHDHGSIAPNAFDPDLDELPDDVGGVL